jgi:hypothetical protein
MATSELCMMGCGRRWDQEGDFDDCPSAYHSPNLSPKSKSGKISIKTNYCMRCKGELICNEVEIHNEFYEFGAYCDNERCDRFLILVV